MFRTLARLFLPNPLDGMLKRTVRKGGKKIVLGWNRGLGDIPLGLYAMVHRIRASIPDAEITFLTRENLKEGFSLLEGVKAIAIPEWKRGEMRPVKERADQLGLTYDLLIEKPSPTDWVSWQQGQITPKLKWDKSYDALCEKFSLEEEITYIGVQVAAETQHGPWRNWPLEKWSELFDRLEKREKVKILLFGFGSEPKFPQKNIVDLRGKTTLFELLSLIKNRCAALILPDSGIAATTYYLDVSFPLRLITLWADPTQGILKQKVASPNPQLLHFPLIGERRDLSTVSVEAVMKALFPPQPLSSCISLREIEKKSVTRAGAIILAGGQGTRLGFAGPKGLFSVAGKSLFQWLCEKGPPSLPLAIMTSPLNHRETVAYFKKNQFFGREIYFFQQEMEPFLDEKMRPLRRKGPNGNGAVFRSFVQAGLAALFAQKGIDLISVTNIDNPLTDPFDPALLTWAREEKAEVTIQCIERAADCASMGVLVEREGKIGIVEYTELDPSQKYEYAYTGQLVFTLPFFVQMAEQKLPLHWVRKKVEGNWIWKGEHFIFDVLPFALRTGAVCVPRTLCYAPVKSVEQLTEVEKRLRETQ